MSKGEIACYEQFLLFTQCFQKACFPGASKGVILWEWVKMFSTQSLVVRTLKQRALENFVRKGENAGNQHFLLFPQCFPAYQDMFTSSLYPRKTNVFRSIQESACLSVRPSVYKITFCQNTGGCIKSHLVKTLVLAILILLSANAFRFVKAKI